MCGFRSPVCPVARRRVAVCSRSCVFIYQHLGLCTSPLASSNHDSIAPMTMHGAQAYTRHDPLSLAVVVLTLPRTTQVTTLRLHLYLLDHTPCNLGGSHSPHPFSDVRIDCGRGRREFVRAVAVVNVIGIFQTRRRQWNGGARPSGGGARRGWWRQWAGLPECVAAEIADHPPRRSERLPKRR